jgi:hypothetical protein
MAESKSTGHSEKSTKFDPFQSIGWMLIPNASPPLRKPCGAPLSIALDRAPVLTTQRAQPRQADGEAKL